MVEEALRDPISVGMLRVDGSSLMDTFHVEPGPKIGWTLNALLEEVLEDPKKNTEEYLNGKAAELLKLPEAKLRELGESGKKRREEREEEELKKILDKHHVS
jgi:hypothetical protein